MGAECATPMPAHDLLPARMLPAETQRVLRDNG
jgi:hypothetical protein